MKKVPSKILSLLLCMALMLGGLPITAFAAEQPTVVITPTPSSSTITVIAGAAFTITLQFSSTDTLTYLDYSASDFDTKVLGVHASPNLTAKTITFSKTTTVDMTGTYLISYDAKTSDDAGDRLTGLLIVDIVTVPVITSANSTTFTVGEAGSFTVTAANTPTSFAMVGDSFNGLSFNSTSGVLSGTPTVGMDGSYDLTFSASNAAGSSTTQNFTLTVNAAAIAKIKANPDSITFSAVPGYDNSIVFGSTTVTTTSSTQVAVDVSLKTGTHFTTPGSTLYVDNSSGGTVIVIPNSGLLDGTYTDTLLLTANGETLEVPVSFTVGSATPPTINGATSGTDTIELTEGYAEYSKKYTLGGIPTPAADIDGGELNTANAGVTSDGKLVIPAGLTAAGSPYFTTIIAETATMTVTVNVSAVTKTITIDSQPVGTTTVTAGSITGSLLTAATVSPSGTPAYQWYSNTTAANTGGSIINDATSASFPIPTGLTAGTYYYYCVVSATGAVSITTNVAKLTVTTGANAAPAITGQPQNKSVSEGQTAAFSVTASGIPAPTYQWQVDKGSGFANVTDGTGATTANYTTPVTTAAMSGYKYQCVVTNSQGTATSDAATVTVTPPTAPTIAITTQPQNKTVTAGSITDSLLTEAMVSPSGTPTYQWYSYTTTTGSLIINDATSASFPIPTGLTAGTYYYYCVVSATDAFFKSTNIVTVTVNPASVTHTVTFNLDGGTRTGGGKLQQAVTHGGAAIAPTVSRTLYIFNGWDKDFSAVTGDLTVTARWNITGAGTLNPSNDYVSYSNSSNSSSNDYNSSSNNYILNRRRYIVDAAEARKLLKEAGNSDTITIKFSGEITITQEAWAVFYKAGVTVVTDTTGSPVQTRVTIKEPGKIKTDLNVSGAVKGTFADNVKRFFAIWFINEMRIVHWDNAGAWSQSADMAARLDLTGMDTNNLYFYSYNKKANKYTRINEPNYWIDKNGYLHFTSELAGEIVVSNGALVKK